MFFFHDSHGWRFIIFIIIFRVSFLSAVHPRALSAPAGPVRYCFLWHEEYMKG